MAVSNESTSNHDALNEAIAEYIEAVEAGLSPDRHSFVARHPGLEIGLRAFFSDRDRFIADAHRLTSPQLPVKLGENIAYLGDYELLEVIATGGMGIVYRAKQRSLQRMVAVKMIRAGEFASPTDVQRFRMEAEAAANLDHPNIVPIYEVGDHHGHQYYSMKLIEGGRFLGDRKNKPARDLEDQRELARTLAKVARAVHFAHERGIIHRDLKPENILLDKNGEPFVADFGLAKRMEASDSLSGSGAIVGTAFYMAPEQARAEKLLTTAVDVYALGAILYEALTGKPPHVGPGILDILKQVCEDDVIPPSEKNAVVHRDIEAIALKCLQRKPSSRYSTAADLASDLENFAAGEPVSARPLTFKQKAINWFRANLWSATAVLLIGIGSGLLIAAPNRADANGFIETRRQQVTDPQGSKRLSVTVEKKYGTELFTGSISIGAVFLAMLIIRPERRSADLAIGAALGFIAIFAYLIAAGGDHISVNREWLDWQIKHTNAITATIKNGQVDAKALENVISSLSNVKDAVSTAFRSVVFSSLGNLPIFALAALYLGRIRRERPPSAQYWVGGGLLCLLLSGFGTWLIPKGTLLYSVAEWLAMAIVVLWLYFYRLVISGPFFLRALWVFLLIFNYVFNRTKSYWPSEVAEHGRELVTLAFLVIVIVSALTDGSPEENEDTDDEEKESEELRPAVAT